MSCLGKYKVLRCEENFVHDIGQKRLLLVLFVQLPAPLGLSLARNIVEFNLRPIGAYVPLESRVHQQLQRQDVVVGADQVPQEAHRVATNAPGLGSLAAQVEAGSFLPPFEAPPTPPRRPPTATAKRTLLNWWRSERPC
jgi:hypothetical protein